MSSTETPQREHPAPQLAVRIDPVNPDHHLWNNHGTWFVHYTVYPTPCTAQRIRHSLRTKCRLTARARRDALFDCLARAAEPAAPVLLQTTARWRHRNGRTLEEAAA